MAELQLLPCPVCSKEPKRNGRLGAGGVLCSSAFPVAHRVQTYGPDQAAADAAWNTRPAASPITGEARDALEPFAHFATNNTDDEGWAGLCCQNDRIRDWLGPSDFRRALKVFSALSTPKP